MHRSVPLFLLLAWFTLAACSEESQGATGEAVAAPSRDGWNPTEAYPGYTMFAPLESSTTYLIDMQGEVVHSWPSEHEDGSNYLMDDGSIFRCSVVKDPPVFEAGGQAGRLERINWEGETTWSWPYSSEDHLQHHDIEPMPNGNVLFISWERITREDALAMGRDPELLEWDTLWPDKIVEVKPLPPDGAEIVWEWRAWDHLIQDFDASAPNYGDPAEHPERIDINGDRKPAELQLTPEEEDEEIARLEELGYAGGASDEEEDEQATEDDEEQKPEEDDKADEKRRRRTADWLHTNAIDYHPELDLIVISPRRFHEIWVIDHSTSMEEARGSTGGRHGKGGDLVYRWGNPATYGKGTWEERVLYGQHHIQWIPEGFLGAGNFILFNNGNKKDGRPWSSIEEFRMPMDAAGNILIGEDGRFGPEGTEWHYEAEDKESFFSSFISGTQRLPNGNTLICSGEHGVVFEVTPSGETVWEWKNEFGEVKEPDPEKPDDNPNRFRTALFRATRIAPDHPGLSRLKP